MNKDFKASAIKNAKMRLRTHDYKDLMKLKTLRPAAGIVVLAGECLSADEISDYFDKVRIGDLFDLEPDNREDIEAIVSATDSMNREACEEFYEAILNKFYRARRKERISAITAGLKTAEGAEKKQLEAELLELLNNNK